MGPILPRSSMEVKMRREVQARIVRTQTTTEKPVLMVKLKWTLSR